MLFTTSGWVYVWKIPKKAYNPEVKHRSGSVMIWAVISQYTAGPIIALCGQITASDCVDILGDPVNPVVQILFPNNDAIFQDDSSHTHNQKCSVWFEEHEDALHLPWPAQLPYLNISNCCD
jgi:hypothetical protein